MTERFTAEHRERLDLAYVPGDGPPDGEYGKSGYWMINVEPRTRPGDDGGTIISVGFAALMVTAAVKDPDHFAAWVSARLSAPEVRLADRDAVKRALQASRGWPSCLHPGPAADAVLGLAIEDHRPRGWLGRWVDRFIDACDAKSRELEAKAGLVREETRRELEVREAFSAGAVSMIKRSGEAQRRAMCGMENVIAADCDDYVKGLPF